MNKLYRFVPALVWMCFIFYLSSRQTTSVQSVVVNRFYILKTFHLIEYAILAILLFFATLKNFPSALIAYLFSLTDEIHQLSTPGRSGRFYDTYYDFIGIIFGLLIVYFIRQLSTRQKIVK